jgi:hypothetical protein
MIAISRSYVVLLHMNCLNAPMYIVTKKEQDLVIQVNSLFKILF